MQRSVDRRRNRIIAESALRVEIDHFILKLDSVIDLFELKQFVKSKRGKAGALDASKIAAAAFNPENLADYAVQRIYLVQLRTCVSSPKIGDSQVGAKQVRPVSQKLWRIEL